MLVLEGIYPAVPIHFAWGGTKGQNEYIPAATKLIRGRGWLLAQHSILWSLWWYCLPLVADSPVGLPSYPLFSLTKSWQPWCATEWERGYTAEFHGQYHSVCFLAHLWKSVLYWTHRGVNFPPKGENTELPDQGYATQGEVLGNQTNGRTSKVATHLI